MNTKHIILLLSVVSAWLLSSLAYANTFTIINNTDKPIDIVQIDRIEYEYFRFERAYVIELEHYIELPARVLPGTITRRTLRVYRTEDPFSRFSAGLYLIYPQHFDATGFVTTILKPGESKTGSYEYLRGPDSNVVRGQIWLEKNKFYGARELQGLMQSKLWHKEVQLQTDLRRWFYPVKQVTIIK